MNTYRTRMGRPNMQRRWFLALALVLIAQSVGCRRPKGEVEQPVAEFLADVPLEVENRNFLDVTVYILQQGNRRRLGTVTGSSTGTVMIPKELLRSYAGELRFVVDPIGSRNTVVSDAVSIRPGEHIHLTLDTIGRSGIRPSIAVVQ